MRIVDTDLPVSIISKLDLAGIKTLEQLARTNKKTLLAIQQIGISAVGKIKHYLDTMNIANEL